MTKQTNDKLSIIIFDTICIVVSLMIIVAVVFIFKECYNNNHNVVKAAETPMTTAIITINIPPVTEPIVEKINTENEVSQIKSTDNEKYINVFSVQKNAGGIGDFGKEQLYFLEEQCEKYGIPVELMLSLIYTESSFRSTATASTSSAAGYCQIIKGTAKWIYEDKLKYGTYDVDNHTEIMTTNWKLNIEISCRYIYLLYWTTGETWENAIMNYYGSNNPETDTIYLNKINSRMTELFNITISDLK